MCKLCQEQPVYEFTNQRKLCKRCFIDYFQKKFLYTIRKFEMIKPGEKVGYLASSDVNSVVLKEMLLFLSSKSNLLIIEFTPKNKVSYSKIDKFAESDCIDLQSEEILENIIHGDIKNLDNYLPTVGKNNKIIKPLYLFLEEEIILFAKLKDLKFIIPKKKEDSLSLFVNDFEKSHPEVKRAVVNSLLKIYKV